MWNQVALLGALDARDALEGMLAQAAGQGSPVTMIGFLVMMVAIFYFFLIRPQSKQMKEHKAMLASLKKGDVVVTSGGVIGEVHLVTDKFLIVEVAPSVRLKVLPSSVSSKASQALLGGEEPKGEGRAEKADEKR